MKKYDGEVPHERVEKLFDKKVPALKPWTTLSDPPHPSARARELDASDSILPFGHMIVARYTRVCRSAPT